MPVTTRSQNRLMIPIMNNVYDLVVNLDFDESSRAWRANKRHIGNGYFIYKTPSSNIHGLHQQSPWLPIEEDPKPQKRPRNPPIRYDPSPSNSFGGTKLR